MTTTEDRSATEQPATDRPDGSAIMREFVPSSPLVGHLGIELDDLGEGTARLRLPFREHNATLGTVVHGGALASLIDTAAMAAAWAGEPAPERLHGATVSLSVSYVTPADGVDVVATATVVHRGRRLHTVRVDATDPDGQAVASALVTCQKG